MSPVLVTQACPDDKVANVNLKVVYMPPRRRINGKTARHVEEGKNSGRR